MGMEIRRQRVIDALLSRGMIAAADKASRVLRDPVDLEQVCQFAEQQGLPRDELINEVGGSP